MWLRRLGQEVSNLGIEPPAVLVRKWGSYRCFQRAGKAPGLVSTYIKPASEESLWVKYYHT